MTPLLSFSHESKQDLIHSRIAATEATILFVDRHEELGLVAAIVATCLLAFLLFSSQIYSQTQNARTQILSCPRLSQMELSHQSTIPQWFQEQILRLNDESVRNINLNLRRVTPAMLDALSEALKNNASIQVINLTSCLAAAAAADHAATMLLPLALAVEQNISLQTLHLSYNQLVDAPSLANCISHSSSLVEVHFDHNQLNEDTAMALAMNLSINTSLKVLNLDYNSIGERGGVAIAQALVQNKTLKTLALKRNRLGIHTTHAFLQALRENVSLQSLSLAVNPDMPPTQVQICLHLIKANRDGRYLLYNKNKWKSCNQNSIDGCIRRQDEQGESSRKGLWPFVLARSDPDIIFFFLVEKPSLVPSRCG
jgi:Leucine-rich repeat (LRR) protein